MSDFKPASEAIFHLPGLFEFYGFYSEFLPIYRKHREYFYDNIKLGSIYGAPAGCLWGGGRTENGDEDPRKVKNLLSEYGISARLTFSNSLLTKDHLSDAQCNSLCKIFLEKGSVQNGIIIYSDLLLKYIKESYPEFYFVSSTTKVITGFELLKKELDNGDFTFVVPDFRFNRAFDNLAALAQSQRDKVEFLCNECCPPTCRDRKTCYENVSRKTIGGDAYDHICKAPEGKYGYRFSTAMKNPCFISSDDIFNRYMPLGFSNFKIEGRGLGSALLLEFILYYMTKPEYRLNLREDLYLDSMLDLF